MMMMMMMMTCNAELWICCGFVAVLQSITSCY